MKKWYWYRIVKNNNNPYLEAVSLHAQAREQVGLVRKQLCMDMSVITQLYCQLYITCQLHVSAKNIFGHHQVPLYLHQRWWLYCIIIYCVVFSDNSNQPDDGQN